MAGNEQGKRIQQLCDDITRDPVASLVTNLDWGRLNFEQARADLEQIFAIATQIRNLPIEAMPETEIQHIANVLQNAAQQVGLIRSFTVEQANPTGQRDAVVANIAGVSTQLYIQSQARLPFLALQRGDVRKNEEELGKLVKDFRQVLSEQRADANKKSKELEQIIAAAREAAAKVGVAHFTADFTRVASDLETSANNWLITTGMFAAATIASAIAFPFVFHVEGANMTLQAIQVFTSKLVALGALFTATVWCGGMYKAAKHQATVNHHRANALKTFEAFVKSASDEQTKNAVLMEATRSIFAVGSTGYLEGTEGGADGALKILEIVKSASDPVNGK